MHIEHAVQNVDLNDIRNIVAVATHDAVVKTLTSLQPQQRTLAEYLTREECAEILRLSMSTLQRRIRDGSIPVTRFGRRVLINRMDLERYTNADSLTARRGNA